MFAFGFDFLSFERPSLKPGTVYSTFLRPACLVSGSVWEEKGPRSDEQWESRWDKLLLKLLISFNKIKAKPHTHTHTELRSAQNSWSLDSDLPSLVKMFIVLCTFTLGCLLFLYLDYVGFWEKLTGYCNHVLRFISAVALKDHSDKCINTHACILPQFLVDKLMRGLCIHA